MWNKLTSIFIYNQLMSLQSSHLKNWQTYLSNAMDNIHLSVVLTDKEEKWSRKAEHMAVTEEKTAAIFFSRRIYLTHPKHPPSLKELNSIAQHNCKKNIILKYKHSIAMDRREWV